MRLNRLLLLPLVVLLSPFQGFADDAGAALLQNAQQLLVVTTKDWTNATGKLVLFDRIDGKWKKADAWPIVVGRKGLGWSKNNPVPTGEGPIKKEGDGKSPAGLFELGTAFGLEPKTNLPGLKMSYLPLRSVIECVDDVKSPFYNKIVDRSTISEPRWASSEKMAEYKTEYRLGLVVEHNMNPRVNGDGSCIFIHIWKNAETGTAGCTAMDGKKMEQLLGWLDPLKYPLLVQLPEMEYPRFQEKWALPPLN